MPGRPERSLAYLVVRLSSFGDVVLAEPVVRSLKAADPGCRVTFATYDQYAAIPEMFAGADQVVSVPRGGGPPAPGHPAAGKPPLEGSRGWDVAVDLQNNLRSRRLIGRLGAGRVLRYRRPYARRFVRVYAPWLWRGQLDHTVQLYLKALKPLGIQGGAVAPVLRVPAGHLSQARARFGEGGLIGICPGGSSPHKMWGRERFGTLARLLSCNGRRVAVIGGEHDRSEVEAVAAAASQGAVTFIDGDARAVAAVLSLCPVVVSNDSGLMHLAGAVGSRVVGIFGPTSPVLGFAPLGPGAVVRRDLRCSPCSYHGNRPCRHPRVRCFDEIDPEEVFAVVERVQTSAR